MPTRADIMRLRRTLQRDCQRLERLLQLLVTERELTAAPLDAQLFDPTIRRVQERLEQATAGLRVCEAELGKL